MMPLEWQKDPLLGSWTAFIPAGKYYIRANHNMNWVLHKVKEHRWQVLIVRPRVPAIELGNFPSIEDAKHASEIHWKEHCHEL